jgi:tetratricopeptide (TPR) repeat protein
VLTNLLPGLREIRAPVVSGYLWLAFFFLLLHHDLPSSDHPGSVLRPLFHLFDDLSALGIATVASVAAYLVGSAMQEVLKLLGRLFAPRKPLYAPAGTHLSTDGKRNLARAVRIQVERISRRLFQVAMSPGERGIDEAPGPDAVERELPLVRMLLLDQQSELVGELDRLQAEADLRITVAAPLAALGVYFAFKISYGWGLLLVPAVMLFVQGYQRQREAGDFLAGILHSGRASAPAVTDFEISVDAALERTDLEWKLKGEMAEGDGMAAFRYGNLLASGGEYKKAVEPLTNAVDQGVVQGYVELGLAREQLDEPEEAERAYRDGAERGDRKARKQLAALLRQQQRGEEALEAAKDAEDDDSDEEKKGVELDLPREGKRLSAYRERVSAGDAKAALNLGLLLQRRNDLEEAVSAFERATELDPEDPGPWLALGRLQMRRWHFEEARVAIERALTLEERRFGPEHLEVAKTLGILGGILQALGRDRKALDLARRALQIKERELPSDSLEVAQSVLAESSALDDLGRWSEALAGYQQAIPVAEEHLPSESLSLGIFWGNLANTRLHLGDISEALELQEKALRLEQQADATALDTGLTLNNIGNVRSALGEYRQALQLHEDALAVHEKELGSHVLSVAEILDGVGDALVGLGRFDDGLAALKRGLGIKEALGVSKLRIALTMHRVGRALAGLGSYQQALEVQEGAMRRAKEELPDDEAHPFVATLLAEQGRLLVHLDRNKEAQLKLREAREMAEGRGASFAVAYVRSLLGEGEAGLARGRLLQAEASVSAAMEFVEDLYGPMNPLLLEALRLWAQIREAAGAEEAAASARERAKDIDQRLNPPSVDGPSIK